MNKSPFKPFIWAGVVILVFTLVACSGAPAPSPEPAVTQAPPAAEESVVQAEPSPQPEPSPTPEPTPEPPAKTNAVTNLQDVRLAVVQIEAEGTFIDPEVGLQVNVGSRGTGFIISEDGIAVTNNHVVTGAALLRVYVPGETRPRNARILGVSECSDLAVIDISGDDFHYLEWYEGDINVGLKVYAAGFPLGEPEFTLTDGIVSKARADGETSWASVDWVIEHSAKINPGNSGGPLVDENGKLIGVNYAGVSATDQNYAISRDVAVSVIREMEKGEDVDSIGVNGLAVYGEVGGSPIYGVWVRSVAAGSPADKARIKAGDIIYQLQGQVLAVNGTMEDYCDILRTRRITSTMDLTIIRFDDLTLLEGQLNGRELEVTGYFNDIGSSTDPTQEYGNWVNDGCSINEDGNLSCLDETATIYVEVPADWIDYEGGRWYFDNEAIGVKIEVAPSLVDFDSYWDASGLFFAASDTFAKWGGFVQFLDILTEDYRPGCKLEGRYDYNDGYYRGRYDKYINCGGSGGYDAYVLAAVSIQNQGAYIIVLTLQTPKGETDIWDLVRSTFFVGDL
jgi:serine protease Do